MKNEKHFYFKNNKFEIYCPARVLQFAKMCNFQGCILQVFTAVLFNPLETKRRVLYLKTQFVPRSKHFSSRYKNESVYAVSGTSRCLFSDKYKTHKYSLDRAYNC